MKASSLNLEIQLLVQYFKSSGYSSRDQTAQVEYLATAERPTRDVQDLSYPLSHTIMDSMSSTLKFNQTTSTAKNQTPKSSKYGIPTGISECLSKGDH